MQPGEKTPEDASAQSGGSRSKDAKETGSSVTGGSVGGGKSKDGPSPKIHDRNEPGVHNSEKQAEVEKHNREFEQRYDRAPEAADDKVDKKFWSGKFGGAHILVDFMLTSSQVKGERAIHRSSNSFYA